MRISDWSSDMCSSDLACPRPRGSAAAMAGALAPRPGRSTQWALPALFVRLSLHRGGPYGVGLSMRGPAMQGQQVCAVVVTHHPELVALRALLDCVGPQVGRVLVVDNASSTGTVERLQRGDWPGNVTVVLNAINLGIGAAFNQAATWAREHGLDHLLLLDQDSLPAPDMVAQLLAALATASAEAPTAAVGPRFVDERSGQPAPFVRIGFPLNEKIQCADGAVLECDFLISSGTLIPLRVLDEVGTMDESLFIDNIDLE